MAPRAVAAEQPQKEYKCHSCDTAYKGKTIIRWPHTPSKMVTVCIDCFDKLSKKEGAPVDIRGFISWYEDKKIAVSAATKLRQATSRIEELERLVRDLNRAMQDSR